jgi:heat shock protein HslJ
MTLISCNSLTNITNPIADAPLEGTYQVLTFGKIPVIGKAPFMSFNADGSLKGNTSCNSFFGNFKTTIPSLEINDLGWTEMACEPELLMQTEGSFLNAIQKAKSYGQLKGILSLYDGNNGGNLLLTAKLVTD